MKKRNKKLTTERNNMDNRWIPIEEKLPETPNENCEDNKKFYVTIKVNNGLKVEECEWINYGNHCNWDGICTGSKIIAWMPKELPTPYIIT